MALEAISLPYSLPFPKLPLEWCSPWSIATTWTYAQYSTAWCGGIGMDDSMSWTGWQWMASSCHCPSRDRSTYGAAVPQSWFNRADPWLLFWACLFGIGNVWEILRNGHCLWVKACAWLNVTFRLISSQEVGSWACSQCCQALQAMCPML